MVGAPSNNAVVETNDGATIASGNLCGLHGEFDVSSVIAGWTGVRTLRCGW